jgi:hypothetical protein
MRQLEPEELRAVGIGIRHQGYNLFALGPSATAKGLKVLRANLHGAAAPSSAG